MIDAVTARFHAVNGDHPMTPEDDEYVSTWFVPLEDLAADAGVDADELRRLILANRLPLPSYIRSDGAQMVSRDLLDLLEEAGGPDRLIEWFAAQFPSAAEAMLQWDGYLSGQYVCLRRVRPEQMRRKDELVDELDAIEPPFAPYDRLRFGGPVSRDRLIEDVRRDYPKTHAAAAS